MQTATDITPTAEPEPRLPTSRRRPWLRPVMWVLGILVLSAAVVARVGRFGFNPTDQGFVLAQSWRILHGEIPHIDLGSPRPLGSAYLHTVDFLVPAPLMVSSSFVMMVQLAVATIALAALLTGTSPLTWGPLRTALVAAAAIVNLNTYPLMAWHTVDGVFLTAVGWWALDSGLRSGVRWQRWLGLFSLGFAVIVKQSFAFAVPLGILLLLFHSGTGAKNGLWWRRSIVDLLWLGAAPLGYFGLITVRGGLPEAIAQLTGGQQTWGETLYGFWSAGFHGFRSDPRTFILLTALGALVIAALWLFRQRLGVAGRVLRLVTAVAITAVVAFVLVNGKFEHANSWPLAVLWIFLVAAGMDAVVRRRFPWQQLLVALLGWMSSLSWGYQLPSLVAGTMALGTLDLLVVALSDLPKPNVRRLSLVSFKVAGALAGVVVFLLAGVQLMTAHDKAPYADRPQGELTKDLGDVAAPMRWVRTNPSVFTYVSQIRDCLARYPAKNVAVLPDNPFAYPVFKVRNPFPMDWPLPQELVGNTKQQMLDTAQRLDRDGDYLVLFQTIQVEVLIAADPVPTDVAPDAETFGRSYVEPAVRKALHGQAVSCGNFAGVWAAAR
ncbi:hypothetical protein AB0M80_24225 [Amycolatopsis sp. NPDC051045]|uniref:hypothetical protein n=1 Tax=Amycolatopsis sp. NPDC051045 TaxID=3156922 RepID=UPI003425A134